MKEFLFLIKTKGNPIASLSEKQQKEHISKVGRFIGSLSEKGRMKSAQPLEMSGVILSGSKGTFEEVPLNVETETVDGYYLVEAQSLEEAVSVAKSDPRFEDAYWTMEIRPILNIAGIN